MSENALITLHMGTKILIDASTFSWAKVGRADWQNPAGTIDPILGTQFGRLDTSFDRSEKSAHLEEINALASIVRHADLKGFNFCTSDLIEEEKQTQNHRRYVIHPGDLSLLSEVDIRNLKLPRHPKEKIVSEMLSGVSYARLWRNP